MSVLCVGGTHYSTWNECANVLLERFFPLSGLNVEGSMEECVNERKDVQVRSFEWQEVDVAVRRAKLGKAPGLDGLTSETFVEFDSRMSEDFVRCMDVFRMCGRKHM